MISFELICGFGFGVEFPHLIGEEGFYFVGHVGPIRVVWCSQEFAKEFENGD